MPTYAFVHIPKTSGTTLKHILRRHFRTRHFDGRLLHHQQHTSLAKCRPIRAADYTQLRWIGTRIRSFAGQAFDPIQILQMLYRNCSTTRFSVIQ